jgi:hypothetical protein
MLGTPNIVARPPFSKAGSNGRNGNGHRHHPHEYMRDGTCRAAVRAFTAASMYRAPGNQCSLADCALMCGSCVAYIRAALVLLEHDDPVLIEQVMRGRINILAAAKEIKAEMKLVAAFRSASPAARAAAGARIGSGVLWDTMVEPAISD